MVMALPWADFQADLDLNASQLDDLWGPDFPQPLEISSRAEAREEPLPPWRRFFFLKLGPLSRSLKI